VKQLILSIVSFVIVVPLLAAPPLKKENLLVNGSFEEGPELKVFKALDKDSTEIKGWVVTRGQIDIVEGKEGPWKAGEGNRSIDLHGSPGHGGVKQTFDTKAGKRYRVTFMFSGNSGVGHEKVQLAVEAAGESKEFVFNMAGVTYLDMKWEKKTWEFKATDKTTTLELRTAMPATSNAFAGPVIDDVKVVEID
jgi:choice-of-anchor C domain-containing protein